MPSTIASNFPNLVILDLSNNSLTGTFPAIAVTVKNLFDFEYTEPITALPFLVLLDLGHNSIKGTVPEALGQMSSLAYLSLGFNEFSGTAPGLDLDRLQSVDLLEECAMGFQPPLDETAAFCEPCPLGTFKAAVGNTACTLGGVARRGSPPPPPPKPLPVCPLASHM